VGPKGNLENCAALIEQLARFSNVYFLGNKEVSALPAYTQHLDVCILCYAINDYTKYIYPLKLHEYLASGRPIVGSTIHSLQEFSHIIRLARTVEEWSEAIKDSLHRDVSSPTQAKERQDIARQYDWNVLVRRIAYHLCARLGPEYIERFEKIPSVESPKVTSPPKTTAS
jgi:glycosyltransferase involved in cell wall biosynthesis